jgi:aspartate/methionine/tyrosine aminotransferase
MENYTSRMHAVQSPIIPVVGELIRSCPGTISLGQGVVYYSPPPEAAQQISQFLADPENHKYKAVHGIAPLREVISQKLNAENCISTNRQNYRRTGVSPVIVVTAGSNMGFMNAVLAITSPGDEIIIQTPYYFNHEMAIVTAGCRPVLVETDENYQLRPDAIEGAITGKTRAVVIISPNNPTGAVYSPEALRAVNEICRRRGLYHISDEAYEYFTYDGVQHFSPGSIENSSEHTISLFSLSKAYGFASWRIGYMVIPEHLFLSVQKIQDTILICPPVVSQYAALGALQAGSSYYREKINAIAEVRQLVLDELEGVRDFCTIPEADGAFYFLLKVHTELGAMEVVEKLVREYGVAAIPGTTFGMDSGCYLRVAYGALEKETAKEGIGRLVRGLQKIAGAGG